LKKKCIYIAHSSSFDYKSELYIPLEESKIAKSFRLIKPHEGLFEPLDAKNYLKASQFMIAEVSYPSIGLGIELGWASTLEIDIICIYKLGHKPSSAINFITKTYIEYSNKLDLISSLEKYFNLC
jgi:hypothetical protein